MAREKLQSVTTSRAASRAGLWATGPRELTLPVEAPGLSERVVANRGLALGDYDVLAWLCERWLSRPTDSGWMRPTYYEVGSDLYGQPPSGKQHLLIDASLLRLAEVLITLDGYDGETGKYSARRVSHEHLIERLVRPRDDPEGRHRCSLKLSEWVREQLDTGNPLRLNWRILRSFSYQQKLAKRLWIYLAAERWRHQGDGNTEATWIAVGDRLFAALGMDYAEPKFARRALKRASATVAQVDDRLGMGRVELQRQGSRWRLYAERPTERVWTERRKIRAQVRESLGHAA